MDYIKFSIHRPVTVIVGIIIVVIFGLIGLNRLPYQLSPSVVEPEITVNTTWRGATPYEVEREIVEKQENTLKGIPGLVEMESDSINGRASITLRFRIGTDVDNALLRVSNKVNEVRGYPDGADKPVISATGSATSPVIWMAIKTLEGNPRDINTYNSYFEDEVRQYLERVEGVADLFIGGGTLDEMHVIVDSYKLASHGLTINDMVRALNAENVNVSAGTIGVGRRDYRVRTTAEFKSAEDISKVAIRSTGQRRIYIGDVAEVREGHAKKDASVFHNGQPSMVIGIKPEPGTNILQLTDNVEKAVNWLNEEKLRERGIYIQWVYDQRFYINAAIGLIKENILVGGILAAIVLLSFLRSIRSTVVVAAAMPISIIGTFMFMYAFGRNLNVVSLAGIAFAVGMLVDNAIVVMENIDRHRKMGKSAFKASYDGAMEVWGAVLASTLTTIAVFLPVIFIEEEAGQLFRDISIAIVSSVSISLIVSILVIPMFASRIFSIGYLKKGGLRAGDFIGSLGLRISDAIMRMVGLSLRTVRGRITTVALLAALSVVAVLALWPKSEYLPQGNRNFILNLFVPPPGLSVEEREEIGRTYFKMAEPYIGKPEVDGAPGIRSMFFVARDNIMLAGAMSTDEQRAGELRPLFQRMIFSVPGMVGVSIQPGIFQTRLGRGRSVDIDLSGGDLDGLVGAAGMMYGKIKGAMPEAQIRPVPSIELIYPEVRIVPERDKLRSAGLDATDLGVALDVLLDGRAVGEFKAEGRKKVDLVLMSGKDAVRTPEDLYHSSLSTPGGRIVPVSSFSTLERGYGITQIRHLERNRAITLQVTPPDTMPLQSAMETIDAEVIGPMKQQGMLQGMTVSLSGAADKLLEVGRVMKWNFVLAMVICYLLMASLFGDFIYPLIIMFSVPLAAAGGFIGLGLLNLFTNQPLDIVTMLGFVMLIGVVVNNAILIVHQSLNNVRYNDMGHLDAVMTATQTRLRPIYMSAMTSIFGMLPLVVSPGAGSELYRGLGSVMLGGIAVSTVFTVFMIPPLLMFVIVRERPYTETEKEMSV